ncbi:HEXXH motif domain-containing protein [Planobispora rosea]|uniref:HEXXH motif domain-containing protein n=1 Tax=Planobispora rosea TaxID=35762 RepID=A0A8J3SAI4_PLARO|nr:HEXXH motif domain-containing protein [Planobispora rosea]GGS83986.1 HEXXH motif domain-containing protein [Planobispora rosea]GIH86278.1 HEXXH motif domain-containing protein [Planobispora rosea]
MTLLSHRISGRVFTELATGGGGSEAAAELCAVQRVRNRLLVRGVVEEARTAGHPHAGVAADAYGLLADLEERAAGAVDTVLRYPAAGAWAWRTYRSLAEKGDGAPERLGLLAAAAAIRAGVACEMRLPAAEGTLMIPSLGEATLPAGPGGMTDVSVRPDGTGAELVAGGSVVRVDPSADGPGWRVLHRLPVAPGFAPVIDDLDPYRWSSDDDLEPRLTTDRRRIWRSRLDEAWHLLAAHHQVVAEEVSSMISVLTPIKAPTRGHNSATGQETFGTVALSDPPSGVRLAETLAHETQHAKLTALLDVIGLTLPDDGWRGYAPWRPDPRPVSGLLQGAYAFLGVAAFWDRQHGFEQDDGAVRAQTEFVRWREGAYAVTGTLLGSGRLTERGEEFVTGMRRTLESLLARPVDPTATEQARQEAAAHREAWVRRNPEWVRRGA